MVKQYDIHLQGLVQGVGFRPFIYNLAQTMILHGYVRNSNEGVDITIQTDEQKIRDFVKRLYKEKPKASTITAIQISETIPHPIFRTFSILPSEEHSQNVTQISPDIAVCDQCLKDMKTQRHRINYPFINCTDCGPRFSIIEKIPYDRTNTTMKQFTMCPQCEKEYKEIKNRRFHAQPIACNKCGPFYYTGKTEKKVPYNWIIRKIVTGINNGQIIALKGVGGYNLICDAHNNQAVKKLRKIKQREAKPFAVMFLSEKEAGEYVKITKDEIKQLTSWRRPIVLLSQKKKLAEEINPGITTLGVILPYMPIHYQILEQTQTDAIVLTSANTNNEPIIIEPDEARQKLSKHISLIIHHNRPIHNRIDDSVISVEKREIRMIRRARGYVPEPIFINGNAKGIIAFGAEKTNTFALGEKNQLLVSQYIGNLRKAETLQFYEETINRFMSLFHFIPELLVSDMHPDYISTKIAENYAEMYNIPLLKVQHHHAHIAAVMLEKNISTPMIAWCLDGVGLGTDGNGWGSELMKTTYQTFERLTHFENVPMPGNDKAAKEPWRMAVAYMKQYGKKTEQYPQDFVKQIGTNKIEIVQQMIDQKINSPYTSGAGRLFDAVASLLGICHKLTYQAEAAMKLEALAARNFKAIYPYTVQKILSFGEMFDGILKDLEKKIDKTEIAAKFHNTLCEMLFQYGLNTLEKENQNSIILTGGVFQNRRLSEKLREKFEKKKITVIEPTLLPCNDGGIAAGQIAIGIKQKENA